MIYLIFRIDSISEESDEDSPITNLKVSKIFSVAMQMKKKKLGTFQNFGCFSTLQLELNIDQIVSLVPLPVSRIDSICVLF